MMVNLELYRVFYVVAKTGNLSKAKHELFISQPAVSQAIKQLENQLGGRLFIRTNKGMELTGEGRAMFEYVEQGYQLIAMAENKFSQMKGLEFGEINIGASDTISKYFLIDYISKFREQHNGIAVKITNRTTDEIISMLKDGKVDVGFVNNCGNINDTAVEVKPCIEIGECFVCNRRTADSIDHPLTAAELTKHTLMMLERKSSTRRLIEDCINACGGNLVPGLELCSVDLIVECAKIGLGLGCVTKEFVKRELANQILFEVPLAFSLPKRNISMVTVKGMPLNFATAKFTECFNK